MKYLKYLLLYSVFVQLPSVSQSQKAKKQYVLHCQFDNLPDRTQVTLKTQNQDTVQSVFSKGNTVTFKGSLDRNGQFMFIWFDPSVTNKSTSPVFVTNRNIKVKGIVGKREVTVIGAKEQLEYDSLLAFERMQIRDLKRITLSLNEFAKTVPIDTLTQKPLNPHDQIKLDSFNALIKHLTQNKIDAIIEWANKHPNSLIAPYALKSQISKEKIAELREMQARMPERTKNSYYGKELEKELKYANVYFNVIKDELFPNLTFADASGKEIKLQDAIKDNKLTLIDCWASWCKPCRAAVPELKTVYEKYKDKGFNILAISSDKDKKAWQDAIKTDQTNWPHYIEIKDEPFSKILTIQSIPSYILLDAEGRLIAFDSPMSEIGIVGSSLRGDLLWAIIETEINKQLKK